MFCVIQVYITIIRNVDCGSPKVEVQTSKRQNIFSAIEAMKVLGRSKRRRRAGGRVEEVLAEISKEEYWFFRGMFSCSIVARFCSSKFLVVIRTMTHTQATGNPSLGDLSGLGLGTVHSPLPTAGQRLPQSMQIQIQSKVAWAHNTHISHALY